MSKIGRILVINSQSIYKNNATGITMRSILSCIPKENILELYRYIPINSVSNDLGIQSIQIPPPDMPLNYVIRRMLGLDNYREKDSIPQATYGNRGGYSFKDISKIYLKAFVESSFLCPSKQFVKVVDDFQPTHIYTMGASFFINKWVLFFARRYKIPVVLHFMDNWRETAYSQDIRLSMIRNIFLKQLDSIENNMSCGLVISGYMEEAYRKKYHRNYKTLMNTVRVQQIQSSSSEVVRIVYAGGMHLGRDKILKRVASCINNSYKYKLYIYTTENDREKYGNEFNGLHVQFKDYVPHDQVNTIYENADVLLHIESFDSQIVPYTKYSMSTKIPEYMSVGKPIICFAPKILAVSKYINKTHVGISVENERELVSALNILESSGMRMEYGKCGIKVAQRYHSENMLQERLEEVFKID